MRFAAVVALLCLLSSSSYAQEKAAPVDPMRAAIEETMTEARKAINELGETESAMSRIQQAVAKLARTPGLTERVDLKELHGSTSMGAAVLASDGEDGITLFVVRFAAEIKTPVHDHLTWGVIHVLEGRDRYVEWRRLDDGTDPDQATLQMKSEKTLEPGHSVYWLTPPHDIHSQETPDEVWELVIAGKNLMGAGVTEHRHYFDPKTGRVTHAKSAQE